MSTGRRPSLSTHVLDTERGIPAVAVPVTLSRWEGDTLRHLTSAETNHDGRIPQLLDDDLEPGIYQLAFDAAAYFHRQGGDASFFRSIVIDFQIEDVTRHYHVPLLLSRYSCSSYRGS